MRLMVAAVQRRSRLLTPEDLAELNERMNDPDRLVRAHAPHDPPAETEPLDNGTLLAKAAGSDAAAFIRRNRGRGR